MFGLGLHEMGERPDSNCLGESQVQYSGSNLLGHIRMAFGPTGTGECALLEFGLSASDQQQVATRGDAL